jgi:prepilin-type N-terminal cleavage/methylation domain-containing protein
MPIPCLSSRWVARRGCGASRQRGFTLLEVMVGVGVLAMLVFSMYRLVGAQLTALQLSKESQMEIALQDGVARYLQQALQSLPAKQSNVLVGIPHLVGMAPADEIQWLSRPGPALLSSAVTDEDYWCTLTIQNAAPPAKGQELGIRRRLMSESDNRYEWIPLVSGVAALEFRYYHSALRVPVDRWEEANMRPAWVRMKLWMRATDQPYEVVLPVPSSRIQ